MTDMGRVSVGAWPEGFGAGGDITTEDDAVRVARTHAAATWEAPAAIGPVLHLFGVDGRPLAYAVVFARDAAAFPPSAAILGRITALQREVGLTPEDRHWATPGLERRLEDEFGRFGTVYVSAQRTRAPVMMTTNTLPPFFFMADLASEALGRAADAGTPDGDLRLGRVVFVSPHEQLVECTAGDRTLLLDSDTMTFIPAEDVAAAADRTTPAPLTPAGDVEDAWRAAVTAPLQATPEADGARASDTVVTVPRPRCIPAVDWTYWCAPTAWTMAFCYWDHFTPGAGTHRGYGRVADFWFDHDPTMHNVPNLIDEIIDRTKTPPTWAGDTFGIVNAQGYNFSRSSIACNAGNGWGWNQIAAEIDAGRPVVVGMTSRTGPNHNAHAMVVYGYRIARTGQRFLLVLNTWGDDWDRQSMQIARGIWQGLPLIRMSAETLRPAGGSGIDHLVLTRPGGGDTITRLYCQRP